MNEKCSQPECNEATADGHHCFPRSLIGNSLWFVEVLHPTPLATDIAQGSPVEREGVEYVAEVIPHVTGLCRAHHDEVEAHWAWVKLEDGTFVWYERNDLLSADAEWTALGPLNPQPGSREGKPKRKKFQGEAKRKRKVISVRVPDDAEEDGAGLLADYVEQLEEMISPGKPRPTYYTVLDALAYAVLNSTPEDFNA